MARSPTLQLRINAKKDIFDLFTFKFKKRGFLQKNSVDTKGDCSRKNQLLVNPNKAPMIRLPNAGICVTTG